VTLGLFCGAMMMFITAVSSQQVTFQVIRWMMGSLDPLGAMRQAHLLPLILPAWIVLIFSARTLNQYRMGDDLAASRGVNIARLQSACVLVTALATAAVVAKCGPIGFVGLVVPHLVGYAFGHDCRVLLPCSAIVGGGFLILCDWASQLSMKFFGRLSGLHLEGSTLPIGVMTAILGVPLFLVLLRAKAR
jgi:iron complex transport system permease protein